MDSIGSTQSSDLESHSLRIKVGDPEHVGMNAGKLIHVSTLSKRDTFVDFFTTVFLKLSGGGGFSVLRNTVFVVSLAALLTDSEMRSRPLSWQLTGATVALCRHFSFSRCVVRSCRTRDPQSKLPPGSVSSSGGCVHQVPLGMGRRCCCEWTFHSLRDWTHVGVVLCELPTASSHFGSTGVL